MDRVKALQAAGLIAWNGKNPSDAIQCETALETVQREWD